MARNPPRFRVRKITAEFTQDSFRSVAGCTRLNYRAQKRVQGIWSTRARCSKWKSRRYRANAPRAQTVYFVCTAFHYGTLSQARSPSFYRNYLF